MRTRHQLHKINVDISIPNFPSSCFPLILRYIYMYSCFLLCSSAFSCIYLHSSAFSCFLHDSIYSPQCKDQGSFGNLRIPPVLTSIPLLSPVFSSILQFYPVFPCILLFSTELACTFRRIPSILPRTSRNYPVLSAVFSFILIFRPYSPVPSYFPLY